MKINSLSQHNNTTEYKKDSLKTNALNTVRRLSIKYEALTDDLPCKPISNTQAHINCNTEGEVRRLSIKYEAPKNDLPCKPTSNTQAHINCNTEGEVRRLLISNGHVSRLASYYEKLNNAKDILPPSYTEVSNKTQTPPSYQEAIKNASGNER